ncbi:MAG: PEP-CTERM sorting domain-containing protein [Akkermansia sp.]|nr:PEP-CTERM sorting domain-containing protein [Akkermansia sp.]
MKLHLPFFLRKSLLSCLAAFIVCTVGSGAAWAEPQNLTHHGSYLYWDTQSESFVNEEGNAAAFTVGDNVSFTGESTVTLCEDISAGTLAIEKGADVTIVLDVYELNVDRIELSGLLDMGYSLHIGEGTTLAVQSASAVLDSNLVLGDKGGFEVGAAASLNHNALTLQGNTSFTLAAAGDGKTYTLLTGITRLVDAAGNTITLDSSNNAISNYFDTTQPGTGFWADAILQLSEDGILRLVRHSEAVKPAVTISTRRTGSVDYQYYEGVHFADIEYTPGSSYARGGAIYGDSSSTITLSDNGSVTFSGNTASSYSYYATGGAIDGDVTMTGNGDVSFSGNTASSSYGVAHGGAIDGDVTMTGNGSVTFSGNTASSSRSDACGGAIYGDDIRLSNNGSVTFSGNTASASSDAYGGAIYGGTITLSDNGSVEFIGNTASSSSAASGGAIYGGSSSNITLSNNKGSITFSGNTAESASSRAYGGAIHGDSGSFITLSNNKGSITFSGNTAESASSYADGGAIYGGSSSNITLSNNGSVSFSGNTASASSDAYGGAIYGGTITLSDNGSVEFSGNTAESASSYAYGGAIYRYVTMTGNGAVTFSGNTASSSSSAASGGAIYGSVTMTGNGDVSFSGNTAASASSDAYGGAIYGGTITLSNNKGSITFSGNTAESASSYAYGGAIYGGTITLSNNKGSITFSGNTASDSSYAKGGAIYGDEDITLSDNGSVVFEGNTAESASSDSSAYGGAIEGSVTMTGNGAVSFSGNTVSGRYAKGGAIYGSVTMTGNGDVSFSGNTASSYGGGGAIYTQGDLSIRNNDSVEFYQNAEVVNGNTYRLRSIFALGGSGAVISLSAAAGKCITFRDSIYIWNLYSNSSFKLNEAYEGKAQLGDIIFTGATTVDDLYAVKGNVAGTAEEILNSRTTEVNTLTNLYGGRLRVEEGAVYKGNGITAMEGSAATVRVQNATLSHVGYDLTFNAGTALEVAGNSTIRGNVSLLADSLFKLEQAATLSLHETLQADAAELTVQGAALLAGSSTLNASLTLADGATLDMMSLDAGAVTINGALTFGGKVEMGTNLMAILNEMRGWEESVTLFTGIESLVLPQVVTSGDSGRVWVGNVFSNLAGNESYYIDFKADVGALLVVHVPEPTTTALSMLALSSLVVRRRRK